MDTFPKKRIVPIKMIAAAGAFDFEPARQLFLSSQSARDAICWTTPQDVAALLAKFAGQDDACLSAEPSPVKPKDASGADAAKTYYKGDVETAYPIYNTDGALYEVFEPSTIIKSGPLEKKGGGTRLWGGTRFKMRWFELDDNTLRYYVRKPDPAALSGSAARKNQKGTILVRDITGVCLDFDDEDQFKICEQTRTGPQFYFLKNGSEHESDNRDCECTRCWVVAVGMAAGLDCKFRYTKIAKKDSQATLQNMKKEADNGSTVTLITGKLDAGTNRYAVLRGDKVEFVKPKNLGGEDWYDESPVADQVFGCYDSNGNPDIDAKVKKSPRPARKKPADGPATSGASANTPEKDLHVDAPKVATLANTPVTGGGAARTGSRESEVFGGVESAESGDEEV